MSNVKLRFAVMSDTHYSCEHPENRLRFKKALETVYGYSEKSEYKNLDALYVVGDFTNRGLPEEFDMFSEDCKRFVRPETKLVITLANHELHYYSDVGAMETFTKLFKMDFDRHDIINGYHFISLSTMQYGGKWHDSFDENKRDFLRDALEEARKDSPGKPIFVFQHPGVKGTVLGSLFGNDELSDILNEYPEIIDFSGHSHCSVNDPREIDQKYFTAVSTGSLYNICQTHKSGIYPYVDRLMKAYDEYAHMLVVEVDETSRVYIKKLDVLAGDFFEDDWVLDCFGDVSAFKYTDARGKKAKPPYFDPDAKILAELRGGELKISLPAAIGVSERVKEYHIFLSDAEGEFYKTVMASDYPALVQEKEINLIIGGVEKECFTVSVKAVGFWNNFSEELSTEVRLWK